MKQDLQNQADENSDNKDDNLEDWEIKLLDDDNQPELYDTQIIAV